MTFEVNVPVIVDDTCSNVCKFFLLDLRSYFHGCRGMSTLGEATCSVISHIYFK